jgi:hypothetical protein
MEVDPASHEHHGVPEEALKKLCKYTFLTTMGPFIQELLDAEEATRTSRIKLYFEKDEKSVIDASIFSGMGVNKSVFKLVLSAVSSFMEKVGTSEVKEIINILRPSK